MGIINLRQEKEVSLVLVVNGEMKEVSVDDAVESINSGRDELHLLRGNVPVKELREIMDFLFKEGVKAERFKKRVLDEYYLLKIEYYAKEANVICDKYDIRTLSKYPDDEDADFSDFACRFIFVELYAKKSLEQKNPFWAINDLNTNRIMLLLKEFKKNHKKSKLLEDVKRLLKLSIKTVENLRELRRINGVKQPIPNEKQILMDLDKAAEEFKDEL